MAPVFRHGKGSFFSLTSATGGVINYSSGIDDCSLARKLDTPDVTTFGDNDKSYIVGLRDASFSVAGIFSSTHVKKLDALLGSTAGGAFVYGPEGTASGGRKYTGSSILTGYDVKSPVGGRVALTFSLQCSGAITSTSY